MGSRRPAGGGGGDRRRFKRKLLEMAEGEGEEEGGGFAPPDGAVALAEHRRTVAELLAELEAERSASGTAVSEAMAMILRLQREKGLLLMEKRQFQRAAEETMAYHQQQLLRLEDLLYRREQALQALSCEVQAYRHRLLSLGISPDFSPHVGGSAALGGDEEDDDDDAEMGNVGRRLRALEAERETMRQVVGSLQADMALLRKIARRIGEDEREEEEEEASPSSTPAAAAVATTTMAMKKPQSPHWCVAFSLWTTIRATLSAALFQGGSFPFLLKIKELIEVLSCNLVRPALQKSALPSKFREENSPLFLSKSPLFFCRAISSTKKLFKN